MFKSIFTLISLTACVLTGVRAGPLPRSATRRAAALNTDQISALAPFTQFARAAYCPPADVQAWTCGGKPGLRIALGNS